MIKCKECGKEASSKTETCPHCGVVVKKQPTQYGCGKVILLGFVVFIFFFITLSLNSNNPTKSRKWYEGGNLSQETAEVWISASYRNRLATTADFIAEATPKAKQDELFDNGGRILKTKSEALEQCISETVFNTKSNSLMVSEIATTCIILLGFDK